LIQTKFLSILQLVLRFCAFSLRIIHARSKQLNSADKTFQIYTNLLKFKTIQLDLNFFSKSFSLGLSWHFLKQYCKMSSNPLHQAYFFKSSAFAGAFIVVRQAIK